MTGYIECPVSGGHSAFIDASLVRGVVPHPELKPWDRATAGKPMQVFLGENRELNIFGFSVLDFLTLCKQVRERSKGLDHVTIVTRDTYTSTLAPHERGYDIQIRYATGVQPD